MNIASITSEYCDNAEEELSQIATEDAGPENEKHDRQI